MSQISGKSFLGRRKSSQTVPAQDGGDSTRRRSIFGGSSKKKSSLPRNASITPEEIEACMSRIRQQLDSLRLQRTDMQRRVEDMNTTLNDIRGECATRISLSGSLSDLSSLGSFVSMSDGSSVSGLSQCYLVEDDSEDDDGCVSSGVDCGDCDTDDTDDDDEALECGSHSSTDTVSDCTPHLDVNLLEVTQTDFL